MGQRQRLLRFALYFIDNRIPILKRRKVFNDQGHQLHDEHDRSLGFQSSRDYVLVRNFIYATLASNTYMKDVKRFQASLFICCVRYALGQSRYSYHWSQLVLVSFQQNVVILFVEGKPTVS